MIENTFITADKGILAEKEIRIEEELLKNKIVIRMLHTLATSQKESSYLSGLLRHIGIENHYGYTSAGMIDYNSTDNSEYVCGDIFLLPAYFQKYVIFTEEEFRDLKDSLCIKVPPNMDLVKILFYPMICLGNEIYWALRSYKTTYMYGCHIVGYFYLQLVSSEKKELFLIPEKGDIGISIINKYVKGVLKDIPNGSIHFNMNCFFDFGTHLTNRLNGINIYDLLEKEYPREPWKYRLLQEQLFCSSWFENLEYKELIDYHVHVEELDFINHCVKSSTPENRVFVYDW